jgi:hypothetical protein
MLNRFISIICNVCNITDEQMKSKRRYSDIKWARFYFFYFASKYTSCTWESIGAAVCKDHATAMHGNKRLISALSTPGYDDIVQKCKIIKTEIEYIIAQKEITIPEKIDKLEKKIKDLKQELWQATLKSA